MKLFATETCDYLPSVDAALVQAIAVAERHSDNHRTLMGAVEALHRVEVGGELVPSGPLEEKLTVAAWNMQRCFYPEQSADLLRLHQPDVVLVSEMDNGMARTHQRNTTQALADSLGMRYAFGLEFFEMGLGNDAEKRLAADLHNALGWHGNAVLCRVEPEAVALIRLDDHGHWFCASPDDVSDNMVRQPRIGGRCAVAAILQTKAGSICVASTHFENNGNGALRQSQMERLIAALDAFAPGLPVIIGGDLNNADGAEKRLPEREPLFAAAERHGFNWDNNAQGHTTRQSPLIKTPRAKRHLDWFCSRGFRACGAEIIPALDQSGKVLSDHDMILGHFEQS